MGPCRIPAPYDPAELRDILERRDNVVKQVEMLEKNSLENLDGIYFCDSLSCMFLSFFFSHEPNRG